MRGTFPLGDYVYARDRQQRQRSDVHPGADPRDRTAPENSVNVTASMICQGTTYSLYRGTTATRSRGASSRSTGPARHHATDTGDDGSERDC